MTFVCVCMPPCYGFLTGRSSVCGLFDRSLLVSSGIYMGPGVRACQSASYIYLSLTSGSDLNHSVSTDMGRVAAMLQLLM